MLGLGILAFCTIIAILGALIRPDQTKDCVQRIEEIEFQPPGFETIILRERLDQYVEEPGVSGMMFFGGTDLKYKNYAITSYEFDGPYIKFMLFNDRGLESDFQVKHLAAILYPLDYKNQYITTEDSVTFIALGEGKIQRSIADMQREVKEEHIFERTYWLGTAQGGRDMLSMIMASLIVSLMVGLIAVFISLTIGISMGAIAGYFRGWVDDLIMYIINVIWSIPTLLIVIAISLAIGKGYEAVFMAVGLTLWVDVARLVRGQVMSVREKEFIEASRALGYNSFRIIVGHVLPNVLGPIIVIAAANFAYAILIESGLSYLGIGTQPPQPSLGGLVTTYKDYVTNDGQAYLAILPGVTIVILVLAFMLIGNGVRDALDNRKVDAPSHDPLETSEDASSRLRSKPGTSGSPSG